VIDSRTESVTTVTVPIDTDTHPFAFCWLVEVQGYEWVKGQDSEWRLATSASGGPDTITRLYYPMRDTRLFLRFAALTGNRTEIRNFANRYGDLFDQHDMADVVRRPEGRYSISQLYGTSMRRWKWEIERMRMLVRVWKAVKGVRRHELRRIVFWKDDTSVGYRLGSGRSWLATRNHNPHLLKRFNPQDVLKPAMYLLQREINRKIAGETSSAHVAIVPLLVWCRGPRINGVAKPDHHQRIIFQPTNLLSAIWLQFAQAVTEEYQLRTCEGCGEYFQVGKGAHRMHTKTCSTRCRQRASRKRRGLC
jgi:hypothetical protein